MNGLKEDQVLKKDYRPQKRLSTEKDERLQKRLSTQQKR
jgi:hypothetical protein